MRYSDVCILGHLPLIAQQNGTIVLSVSDDPPNGLIDGPGRLLLVPLLLGYFIALKYTLSYGALYNSNCIYYHIVHDYSIQLIVVIIFDNYIHMAVSVPHNYLGDILY